MARGDVIVVYLESTDPNPHLAVYKNIVFMIAQALLVCMCIANGILATKNLALFVRQVGGCRLVLPVVMLSLQAAGSFIRAIWLIIYFAYTSGLITYFFGNIVLLLSWPFNLVCTMVRGADVVVWRLTDTPPTAFSADFLVLERTHDSSKGCPHFILGKISQVVRHRLRFAFWHPSLHRSAGLMVGNILLHCNRISHCCYGHCLDNRVDSCWSSRSRAD